VLGGGEPVPVKEWPAAASVVQATREHRECFGGHGAATFQTQMGALYSQSAPGQNPPPLFCLSLIHRPSSIMSLKHWSSLRLLVSVWAATHVSMPALYSAEASYRGATRHRKPD